MTGRRVMMIQQGARRNYVYAQQLERAGLLNMLATDAAWHESDIGLFGSVMRKLGSRRRITGIAPERIVMTSLPNVASLAKYVMHEERVFPLMDEALALVLKTCGLRGADIVVNYLGNGGSFLDSAKRHGASIVTDFIITPRYLEIEDAERRRWSGWESRTTTNSTIELFCRRMSHLVQISDLYLCPSQTVARDLATLPGFDPARVRLVPYGISGVLIEQAKPIPGRVLFAGAAGLRKGIPYLAEAARILKERAQEIEVVVAGTVTDAVRCRAETSALSFLGQIGREAMAREMARADIFCLPSLAEGSATSVFEAMANGLPIVTTPSSGTVVEDGIEGFIVPERDPEAIATAIGAIVKDREMRARMSVAARATAARYDDAACGERFVEVIRELLVTRGAGALTPSPVKDTAA